MVESNTIVEGFCMFNVTAIWRKCVNGACAYVNNFLAVTLSPSPGVGGWLADVGVSLHNPLMLFFSSPHINLTHSNTHPYNSI